jgi:hypothetical protein
MAGETVARATIVLYDGAEQAVAEEVAVLHQEQVRSPRNLADSARAQR